MRDQEPPDHRPTTRYLLWSGAIGPLLFAIIFLIEGATRPDYNAWQTTISTLSLSDQGWMQIANFHLFGLMTLCFAVGLKRVFKTGLASASGPILFAIIGVGLILAGIFVTDPCFGYPASSPVGLPESLHGTIHNLAALAVFLALPVTCFVMGRRFRGDPAWRSWSTISMISGSLILIFFTWFFTSVSASADAISGEAVHAGLLERITSIIGCLWMSALAFRLILWPTGAASGKARQSTRRRPAPD
ncbi:MAG TPA: DUF998 domain-containing protein [Magnetospirillaceae bacterium]|nr:DUF998 domain-containing protein [Magnetospirillaceae bacterium]